MGHDPRENGDGVVALPSLRAPSTSRSAASRSRASRAPGLCRRNVVADLKLALTEACSNSVRHAYEEGRDGIVEVSYRLAEDRIVVEVTDDGAGFDPAVLERAEQELDEGGLGIAIIRAVTDELDIGPNPNGGGSRLRFAKYLN